VSLLEFLALPFVVALVRSKSDHRLRLDDFDVRIRCPQCRWRPARHDRWQCDCGCTWNTFETRGRCPECQKQWRHTKCPRCGEWSPHDDWYVQEPDKT